MDQGYKKKRTMKMPMASRRKWEHLSMNCLVNIFLRVGIESLLLDVPYVCKSWYRATRVPRCWSILNFTKSVLNHHGSSDSPETLSHELNLSEDDFPERLKKRYQLDRDLATASRFIKNVAKRANQHATFLKIPSSCSQDAFRILSDECPNLKTLKLPILMDDDLVSMLPSLVGKWKRLENLSLCWSYNMRQILGQINIHCNNFKMLEIIKSRIAEGEVSYLAATLPNLKGLRFRYVEIGKENLLQILNCFKKLEYLDARGCCGFDNKDVNILTSASHIRVVNLEGATLSKIDEDEDCDEVFTYYGSYF